MHSSRLRFRVTSGFCIAMALSLCLLPLKWAGSWFLALIVHEFCHCLAVVICGGALYEVKVTFFGAEMIANLNSYGKRIFCSLAGPLGGILLLLLRRICPVTALCALVHSAYNLLPLRNLDGGKALINFFYIFFEEEKAEKICNWIDRIMRIMLFAVALCISWYMKWGVLILFAGIVLFRKQGFIKSTCKENRLQVQ